MTLPQSTELRQPVGDSGGKLATVRRLYFYLVALVSFGVMLVAVDGLLDSLADAWLQGRALFTLGGMSFTRMGIARSAGALVVATPFFLLHWRLAQRRAQSEDERRAAMRKFYLYAASALSLGYAIASSVELLAGAARLVLGEPPEFNALLPAEWVHLAAMTIVAALFLVYWLGVTRSDGDYGAEVGVAAWWRRIFYGVVGWVAIGFVIFGSARLIDALLQWLLDRSTIALETTLFAAQAGDALAFLLIGAPLLRWVWSSWQRIADDNDQEARSGLRRLYLYVAVVFGALATLFPAASVLREALLILFSRTGAEPGSLLEQMIEPLSFVPAGLVVWLWHWSKVRADEARYGESAEAATIRRIYYYTVAAIGLVLTWLGLVSIVQTALDRFLVTDLLKAAEFWQAPLADGLSLLAVGAPVWLIHWRAMQRVARQPGDEGAAERGSLPRRIYLYGVALVGALLILFYVAQAAYRLFLYLLGDRAISLFAPETAEELARSMIAGVLWLVHALAIRTDMRMGIQAGDDVERKRQRLQARLAQLEEEAASLRRELASLSTSYVDAPLIDQHAAVPPAEED
jgi:hypothetical protein